MFVSGVLTSSCIPRAGLSLVREIVSDFPLISSEAWLPKMLRIRKGPLYRGFRLESEIVLTQACDASLKFFGIKGLYEEESVN